MNTQTDAKKLLFIIAVTAISFVVMPTVSVFAETKTPVQTATSTAVKKTDPVATPQEEKFIDTEKVQEASTGAWASVKKWFINLYNKVDAWRANQANVWTALKNEKEAEIALQTQTVDENRDNRVNRILNEEQTTLFNGAGNDLKGDGNIFLLRLYTFALTLFVLIFSTAFIFYGILAVIIIAILNKIVQKIRNPHAY